jgi:hypothetical protein
LPPQRGEGTGCARVTRRWCQAVPKASRFPAPAGRVELSSGRALLTSARGLKRIIDSQISEIGRVIHRVFMDQVGLRRGKHSL